MVFDTEVKNKKFNIKQIGLKCYGGKLSKYEFFKVFWTILYPKYGHLKEENANILEMEPNLKKCHYTGCPKKNYTLFWRAVAPLNFELGIKVVGVLESSGSQLFKTVPTFDFWHS